MSEIAVVLGTRPEIIKLAGIVDALGDDARIIHTGQHFDRELSASFLDHFALPAAHQQLSLGGLSRAEQIGRGTSEIAAVLEQLNPAAVVVQGDTNSALAGALAANATGRPLVHVEAGLRSYDRRMPEEHNRVLIDHISDWLAAPTPSAVDNLLREGIADASITCCGNTVVEAVHRQLPDAEQRAETLAEYGLEREKFVLCTIHRPENTDRPDALESLLRGLTELPLPVVFPLHPRTAAAARRAGLDSLLSSLRPIAPLDGVTFLSLAAEAALLISDSGGVQEEVTVLGRPLVVVRRSTERPESLHDFAVLTAPEQVYDAASPFLADPAATHDRLRRLPSPYGDGTASQKIVDGIYQRFT